MIFTTLSGSAYEVDIGSNRIRRLSGVKDPTPRQGQDGQWHSYEHIDLEVGEGAWIHWNPDTTPLLQGNRFGGAPVTVTSEVVKIEKDIN
jgi:hypothetical protein